MQLSLDGFVAGPNGQLDWMTWNWDEGLKKYVSDLTDTVDTILLGRKMTDGFIGHWQNVVDNQPESPEYAFAKKMVDAKKMVFSKSIKKVEGRNTAVENGDLLRTVNQIKSERGKDIIVYGGASFVGSLLNLNLIDELYLFVNPTAIGEGRRIFTDRKNFHLKGAIPFECGVSLLNYRIAE